MQSLQWHQLRERLTAAFETAFNLINSTSESFHAHILDGRIDAFVDADLQNESRSNDDRMGNKIEINTSMNLSNLASVTIETDKKALKSYLYNAGTHEASSKNGEILNGVRWSTEMILLAFCPSIEKTHECVGFARFAQFPESLGFSCQASAHACVKSNDNANGTAKEWNKALNGAYS